MIIFLYGEDTYRSRQKLNEIVESYKKKYPKGLNFRIFDLEEENFLKMKDEARSVSMFGDKKLFLLKNAFNNKEFQESFLKDTKFFLDSKDIFIFFEEGKFKKEKLFNFLIKNAKSQEFNLLRGLQLKNWIRREFDKYDCLIGEKELMKLAEFIGNDLWRLSNEIRKLASFSSKIDEKDIDLLVNSEIESDIFKTIDAIAHGDKKRAILLLRAHLIKGDNPLYLLSMINFQFRNLLMIKDLIERGRSSYLISQITQLHPFVVRKSYSLANKFTFSELKKIYQKIFQVDLDIKTGKIKAEIGLDLFVAYL